MSTLFHNLFVKVIRNVDPAMPGLNETGSWKTCKETDGSTSVITVSLLHIYRPHTRSRLLTCASSARPKDCA